jgi:ribose transport system substrate-binding protein
MVQDPFGMGYLGVKNAVAVLRGEKVPKVVDTGVTVVTRANLADPAVNALVNPPLDQYLK